MTALLRRKSLLKFLENVSKETKGFEFFLNVDPLFGQLFLKWVHNNVKVSKLFLKTSMRFHSALVTIEPQHYVVVRTSWTENILLVSGRLV